MEVHFANARQLLPIFAARLASIERLGDTTVQQSPVERYVAILASQTRPGTTLAIALKRRLSGADAVDDV
jgi:hypothetical protein